jgi:hypothetical protein
VVEAPLRKALRQERLALLELLLAKQELLDEA